MNREEAIRFLLDKILEPFQESQLYEDYANDPDDGFTDDEYHEALAELRTLIA